MDYDNVELIHRIARTIHSERDREIVKAKLIDGKTYKELASKYHLTERGLQYIVLKAKKELFK